MSIKSVAVNVLGGLVCILASGCVPRSEKEVVVYCSVDREFASPILDAFERTEPNVEVSRQFDIEASKSLGLATRIVEESAKPRCDLFWNGEILHTIRLQQKGLLESQNWHLPDKWPEGFAASDGTWVGLGARARVIIVNRKKLLDSSKWPRSVKALAEEIWKGKCGFANPLYGTTATQMAVIHHQGLNKSISPGDGFWHWFAQARKNAVMLSGNKQVAQAVSQGELAWGITDTDDARIEVESGSDVEWFYPDQGEDDAGTLLIPTTISIMKSSPHPIAAKLLATFLVSEKTESRMTMGNAAEFSLWPESAKSIESTNPKVKVMQVDFEAAAKDWDQFSSELQKRIQ